MTSLLSALRLLDQSPLPAPLIVLIDQTRQSSRY